MIVVVAVPATWNYTGEYMRFRHAPLSLFVAAASLVLGGAPASAGPRSHDPCAVNAAFDDVCDAATRDDLRYTCAGVSAVDAQRYDNGTPVHNWDWHVTGVHSCPDFLGDWVRVTGTLEYTFDGVAGGPATCSGFQGCRTDLWGGYYGLSNAFIHVQMVTSTIDVPSGTATDVENYFL